MHILARATGITLLAVGLATGCNGEVNDGSGGGGVTNPQGAAVSSDLPCEAANLLLAHCTGCHGAPPSHGAPQSLDSLATLKAPSPDEPGESNGAHSVEHMADDMDPMPPPPYERVPEAEQAAFAAWVNAGMPAGSCSQLVDAGTP